MGIKDGVVVFNRVFKRKPIEYFITISKEFVVFTLLFLAEYFVFRNILLGGWGYLIIKAILATILYNLLFIIIYRNKPEYKAFIKNIKEIFLNIIKKLKTRKEME